MAIVFELFIMFTQQYKRDPWDVVCVSKKASLL